MSVWAWLMLLTLRKWLRVPVRSDVSGMGFHVVLRRIIVVRILAFSWVWVHTLLLRVEIESWEGRDSCENDVLQVGGKLFRFVLICGGVCLVKV